nr:hypothetical protein [uncultured Blautia sp.]
MKKIVPILLSLTLCLSYFGTNKFNTTQMKSSESNIIVLTSNEYSRDLIPGGGDDV